MRNYVSAILISLMFPVAELHTFWEKGSIREQNWIIKIDRTMALQWNIKLASDQLLWILAALALFFYIPSKANKTAVVCFFTWQLWDTYRYFWNYKLTGYGYGYLIIAGVGLCFYLYKYYYKNRQ